MEMYEQIIKDFLELIEQEHGYIQKKVKKGEDAELTTIRVIYDWFDINPSKVVADMIHFFEAHADRLWIYPHGENEIEFYFKRMNKNFYTYICSFFINIGNTAK